MLKWVFRPCTYVRSLLFSYEASNQPQLEFLIVDTCFPNCGSWLRRSCRLCIIHCLDVMTQFCGPLKLGRRNMESSRPLHHATFYVVLQFRETYSLHPQSMRSFHPENVSSLLVRSAGSHVIGRRLSQLGRAQYKYKPVWKLKPHKLVLGYISKQLGLQIYKPNLTNR
jgi:hypothetical protein